MADPARFELTTSAFGGKGDAMRRLGRDSRDRRVLRGELGGGVPCIADRV